MTEPISNQTNISLEKVIKGLEGLTSPAFTRDLPCSQQLFHDALALLKAQELPTNASISSAIECLLHPQDADDSDMAKAIDTAVRVMRLLKEQEYVTVEPKRPELSDETKAWLDKMDAVEMLSNIADICIDWDGYRTANGLGGLVNEIWAYARYGADKLMKEQSQQDYEAATEMTEYCERYEPTYNPEDGSM